MPRQIVADPVDGLPSQIEEHGSWVQGTLKIVACVYGPDEDVPAG
jgi:hypothetical protein